MEKPLLTPSTLALPSPSSHSWSWFLLSRVGAALWYAPGGRLQESCLALSKEQWYAVTTRRWLMSPCALYFLIGTLGKGGALKEPEGQPL